MRIEFEYERGGALQYLAAWDVHRAKLFGRCEARTGIEPFGRLVEQVMTAEPYRSARRVFWVLDNGSSHRGQAAVTRLTEAYPRLVPVHLPIHASWLNQVEIYFSILERKVLTPADAASLEELAARILAFQDRYEGLAQPFEWKFTRADLTKLLERLAIRGCGPLQEAA
jgi:transposase